MCVRRPGALTKTANRDMVRVFFLILSFLKVQIQRFRLDELGKSR